MQRKQDPQLWDRQSNVACGHILEEIKSEIQDSNIKYQQSILQRDH